MLVFYGGVRGQFLITRINARNKMPVKKKVKEVAKKAVKAKAKKVKAKAKKKVAEAY